MNFGAHISAAGGLQQVFSRAEAVGANIIQLFTKSERQWKAKPLTDELVLAFKTAAAQSTARALLVHDSYLINLASPKDELWEQSIAAFAEELERCVTLGIPYLVTHPGAHTGSGTAVGLVREAEALNRLCGEGVGGDTMVLLETTAGQGTCLGGVFEEIADLIGRLTHPERVGVCLDTCHLFAAGYDLRTPESYAATMTQLATVIGLDRVRAVHVNDSQGGLGSHLDRHAALGEGQLGVEAFRSLVNDARLRDVPMVLETPKTDDGAADRQNLALLRSLRAS